MSKKKAIEAAIDKAGMSVYRGGLRAANIIGDSCYEAGRIAGLREAAKLRSVDGRCAGGAISVSRAAITDHANALAKKARTK